MATFIRIRPILRHMVGRQSRRSVLGASGAALSALLAGCIGDSDPPWEGEGNDVDGWEIRLGMLAPETGPLETLGQELIDGARLVERQLEAADEIGHTLDFEIRDTEADPDTAVTAAQELADEGYEAIIGPGTSESAEAVVQDVVVPEELVVINPLAATALLDISDDGRFFSTAPRGRRLARAIARPLATERILSVAMIVEDNQYGSHIGELTAEELDPRGGDVLSTQKIPGDQTEGLDAVFETAFEDDIEGIVIGTGTELGQRLLETYYGGDYPETHIFLGDRLGLPWLPETVGDPMENARVVSLRPRWHVPRYSPARDDDEDGEDGDDAVDVDDSPAVLDNFFHAFKAEYERIPTIQAAQAFDATVLLLFASLFTGEDFYDGTEISRNIRNISNQQDGVPGVRNNGWDDWWEGVDAIADGVHNNYLGASSDCQFFETGELDSPTFHAAKFAPDDEFGFEELIQIPT